MASKQNFQIKRKRKFHGNQHRNNDDHVQKGNECPIQCSSSRKVKLTEDNFEEDDNYFLLMNFSILKDLVLSTSRCPECNNTNLKFNNKLNLRMGFCHCLKLSCKSCEWTKLFYTSDKCSKQQKTQGRKSFECNVRTVIGFREIARGDQAIENFACCMNMHSTSRTAFIILNSEVFYAYENAAHASMKRPAHELQDEPEEP